MTGAPLDEPRAMADFLSTIPNGEDLGRLLLEHRVLSSRAYDDAAWTARFVASDGESVKCFAVSDITIDQAEMIAAAGADLATMDEAGFRDLVLLALGPTLDPDGA